MDIDSRFHIPMGEIEPGYIIRGTIFPDGNVSLGIYAHNGFFNRHIKPVVARAQRRKS